MRIKVHNYADSDIHFYRKSYKQYTCITCFFVIKVSRIVYDYGNNRAKWKITARPITRIANIEYIFYTRQSFSEWSEKYRQDLQRYFLSV